MRGEFCKSSSFHLCLDISFVLSGCSREGREGEKRECVSVMWLWRCNPKGVGELTLPTPSSIRLFLEVLFMFSFAISTFPGCTAAVLWPMGRGTAKKLLMKP